MEFGKSFYNRVERFFQNLKSNNTNSSGGGSGNNNSRECNATSAYLPTASTSNNTTTSASAATNMRPYIGLEHTSPYPPTGNNNNAAVYHHHHHQAVHHSGLYHGSQGPMNPPSSLSFSSPSSSVATVSPSPSSWASNQRQPTPPAAAVHQYPMGQVPQHPNLVSSSSQPLMPMNSVASHGGVIHQQQQQQQHQYNNSSSSSTNSFFGITPHNGSFSAIQTPDSPIGFPRRQHSLNVTHRQSSRLQLDLRSQKSSPAFGKTSSTELIDTHSLSPRPRPKNLGLSNSHENMSKHFNTPPGVNNMSSRNQKPNQFPFPTQPQSASVAAAAAASNRSQTNNNFYNFANNSRLKYDFSLDKPVIMIAGKKYEQIRESDFQKIRELGSGSFGQVECMLHTPSNTELAVKKMRRSGNQDHNKHILNDLRLLISCNHSNIVKCYGYNVMETEVWIFMELMTTCFDRLLKKLKNPIPESIMGKVTVSTIDTLNYLKKEHKLIHRDIKPSNILINYQGVIKLCDFGISGLLIDSKAHSRSVGCTAYMAPERIEPPDSGTYDIRSDVWSLGITLVEIATGRFPYQGWNSDFEILSMVIQHDPPSLPREQFSKEFCDFIQACLIKRYQDRPKYHELMEYPFYKNSRDAQVDVAEWFRQEYSE